MKLRSSNTRTPKELTIVVLWILHQLKVHCRSQHECDAYIYKHFLTMNDVNTVAQAYRHECGTWIVGAWSPAGRLTIFANAIPVISNGLNNYRSKVTESVWLYVNRQIDAWNADSHRLLVGRISSLLRLWVHTHNYFKYWFCCHQFEMKLVIWRRVR